MSHRIPLDLIEVKNPCPKDWNAMSGTGQKRHCDHCQRHVHDLSAMTESEAQDLICREAGQLCVRFTRMPDGKIATLDYCSIKGRRPFDWGFWTLISAIVLAIGGCVALGRKSRPTQVQGVMCPTFRAPTAPAQPLPGQTPTVSDSSDPG